VGRWQFTYGLGMALEAATLDGNTVF